MNIYVQIQSPELLRQHEAHKALTLRSLPEIGRRFGGRDHTTVMHAVRKIGHLIGTDRALAAEVEALRSKLTGGADAHA